MPVTEEHLRYFRALIEGQPVEGWHLWWPKHQAEFHDLPRHDFLKLKFERMNRAAELLHERGAPFVWSPRGRLRARVACFVPEALDEFGLPSADFTRKTYSKVLSPLEAGDRQGAIRAVNREIKRILKDKELHPAQGLHEYEGDAEFLYLEGEQEAAVLILECLAGLPRGDDLLDPAIEAALSALERIREGAFKP